MPVAGTNWHMAAAAPSGARTTVSSSPVSRGSKTRPSIIEKPRSCSPWRDSRMSEVSSSVRPGSICDGSWKVTV